jgi:cellulose synthase/poly-beta-1,6-N-acetylglucosamine synthase-like glycosyltransferase
VSPWRLDEEIVRELHRAQIAGRPGILAILTVAELDQLRSRLGDRAEQAITELVDELVAIGAPVLEQHSARAEGGFYLLMPETDLVAGRDRLGRLSQAIARTLIDVDGEQIRVTPVVGHAAFAAAGTADELRHHAAVAVRSAELHLDLIPVEFSPDLPAPSEPRTPVAGPSSGKEPARSARIERWGIGLQIAFTLALLLLLPFISYVAVWYGGFDLTAITYPLVAVALLGTAATIWAESFQAVGAVQPPAAIGPPPPASAIVAAYLPNEAATILATVMNLLTQDYPGRLQVILAYNTPQHLPVEDRLAEIAARDPRLLLLRVEGSTSKAQNVNAALRYVHGEFVGVFDADHHPEPGSFLRAWQWLSNGQDVVQGHCVVRNGGSSRISRLVAVEFESIYAVSHPGRARLHGFGIFGGSNGYWRSESLRQIRMQGAMLTEDIDSSMRSLLDGFHIVSDPGLISTELAPTTLSALWNQRMRWAQGWTQTAQRHLRPALRSDKLSLRQKLGAAFLLGWTQIVPWVTIQVIPILAFTAWRDGGVGRVDLLVPTFVLLSLFTFTVGPAQAVFAYVLGDPRIRRHGLWFWVYAVHSLVWFAEFKNLISRVAQLKELVGERQWRVTPRAQETTGVRAENDHQRTG